MKLSSLVIAAAALVCASGGAALAKHGKVGLWDVSSTTDMAMPSVLAEMKKMGVKSTGPQTYSYQMCMSQAEVDSDQPPHIDQGATGCDSKVVGHTESSLVVEMSCKGSMKGAGRMQVAYQGAEHYTGSYTFKGTVEGNATNLKSNFKGNWVKTDCGKVKPYSLRTH